MTEVMTAEQLRAKAEQMKKEAEALEAKAKQAAAEAKEAERKAKEEEEGKRELQMKKVYAHALAAEIESLSNQAQQRKDEHFISVVLVDQVTNGFVRLKLDDDIYTDIDFRQEWSGSTWRGSSNGRLRMSVGGYGSRKSFPQKKDGSFSYSNMAQIIYDEIIARKVRRARANVESGNQKLARKLMAAHGYDPEGWARPVAGSQMKDKPLRLSISINNCVTYNQADEILSHYTAIQAILNRKEESK